MHGFWRENETELQFLATFIKVSPYQTKLFVANKNDNGRRDSVHRIQNTGTELEYRIWIPSNLTL